MSNIKENVIELGIFLEKAKELVDNLRFENAFWINRGIDKKSIDEAESILKEIQIILAMISDSVAEFLSPAIADEIKLALLNKGIKTTFSDLNTIYDDVKLIKKRMASSYDQQSNIKCLKFHFALFAIHCLKIKEQLDETMAGN